MLGFSSLEKVRESHFFICHSHLQLSSLSFHAYKVSKSNLKVPMTRNFLLSYWKELSKWQNDEEWRLFYCDSTLGCRVIQDFDLCKLDYCDVTTGTQTSAKSQKIEYLSRLFLYRTETQYSCYTLHKVSWNVHCDISMVTEWAPGPLHSKWKIRVFLLQEVLFALVVHSVGVSEYGNYKAQAQESVLNSGATLKAFFNLGR